MNRRNFLKGLLALPAIFIFPRLTVQEPGEWVADIDHSTTLEPQQVAFRLQKPYGDHIPQLYYRSADIYGNTFLKYKTTENHRVFSYSLNNGKTWKNVRKDGVIPNKQNLLLRVKPDTTIKQDQQIELKDS